MIPTAVVFVSVVAAVMVAVVVRHAIRILAAAAVAIAVHHFVANVLLVRIIFILFPGAGGG